MTTNTVQYGSTQFTYTSYEHEKECVKIVVTPALEIIVFSPAHLATEQLELHIKKHARWIRTRLNFFKEYQFNIPQRYYISGETHFFLGKQYRLEISKATYNSVSLKGKYIVITTNGRTPVKKQLENWYKAQAKIKLHECFLKCLKQTQIEAVNHPLLKVAHLKKRWGSLSPNKTLTLNAKLIFAPLVCSEYVIFHELTHLLYPNHSALFYRHLANIMPNWQTQKLRLESFPILMTH